MKMDDMVLVSIDDHVIEPGDMFQGRTPEKFKGRMPKLVERDGANIWLVDDKPVPMIGMNAVAGRPRDEYGMEAANFGHMRRAAYDVHARVEDMSANGVLGSMCFPSFPKFAGGTFAKIEDKALALACVQAYNDWHFESWCGAYPDRLIPLALVPLWDPALAVTEMERMSRRGVHAMSFPDNPTAVGLPSVHDEIWEPLWRVCADNDVMITAHIGTGNAAPHASNLTPVDAWILTMPISIANAAGDWLHLRAFQKYPNLKLTLAEGGVGWIPYFLERADITHDRHGAWTHADFGGILPSELFKRHIVTCFIEEKFGVDSLGSMNEDMVTWECDYPHADTTWPRSPEVLWDAVSKLPDATIDKLTHVNAMKLYNFDPFAKRTRAQSTVGALRAQAAHVDTTPRSSGGAKPGQGAARVTSGDIEAMLNASRGVNL